MKKITITLSYVLLFTFGLCAQVGSIDSSFNIGTGFGPDQWTGKCNTILQQPDAKLLVGGQFTTFNGDTMHYLTRLNLDGSRDVSFTSPFQSTWGAEVRGLALQNDGKIIVMGNNLQTASSSSQVGILRLNTDGSVDQSFTAPSSITSASGFALQSDGKIVLSSLTRLNTDGTEDNSFNTGTGISGGSGFGAAGISAIAVQADGKILIGGRYGSYNGTPRLLLSRLHSDGTLDNTFDASAHFAPAADGFYGSVYDISILPNGKIMICGNYGNSNSTAVGIDRLNADGSLDTTFRITSSTDLRCNSIDLQSDGKVFGASVNFGIPSEAYVVERYNTDGSLDTSFPKRFVNNDVKDLIIQSDGNITFVGYFNYNPNGIMRLLGDTPSSVNLAENPFSKFNFYPNPARDLLFISPLPQQAVLRIHELSGKEVLVQKVSESAPAVDVSMLRSGIYLLQMEQRGEISSQKLIIER